MPAVGSDAFADAPTITVGSVSDPTPNATLSSEAGEDLLGGGLGRTAWWRLTPTESGQIVLDTTLSIAAEAGTVISVFTGTGIDDLVEVNTSGFTPQLLITVTAGVTYYVQADTYGADPCEYVLRVRSTHWGEWVQPPDYQVNVTATVGGTAESAEMDATGAPGTALVNEAVDGAIAVMASPGPDVTVGFGVTSRTHDPEASTYRGFARRETHVYAVSADDRRFWPIPSGPADALTRQYEGADATVLSASLEYFFQEQSVDYGGPDDPDVVPLVSATHYYGPVEVEFPGDYVGYWDGLDLTDLMEDPDGRVELPWGTRKDGTLVSHYTPLIDIAVAATFQVDAVTYILRPPRVRYLLVGETTPTRRPVLPPTRVFPRDDGLGASAGLRVWPPPKSQQGSSRIGPGSYW